MSATGYLERVVLGEDKGVLSWLIRLCLFPLTMLYRIGLIIFFLPYLLGVRKKFKLPVPVISVGNITFGGTGKTPAVQTICRLLQKKRLRIVILSRGHGGAAKEAVIVSDGNSVLTDSELVGDEPILLAKSLPGVCVIVGKDRRKSGSAACNKFNPDLIVLDDGLQYWQLHRDLDIIVLNAMKPLGSGFVMPMGDLREPVSALRRAGIVLLSHSQKLDDLSYKRLVGRLKKYAPSADYFRGSHVPLSFLNVRTGEELDLKWVSGQKIFAFCGIGRPSSFMNMLKEMGAVSVGNMVFQDHHSYNCDDIQNIKSAQQQSEADFVITTEKDIARLGKKAEAIDNLYALRIKFDIEEIERFAEQIYIKINKKNKTTAA